MMANIDSDRLAVLARKAKVLMDVWRLERGARLAKQLALNVEVKQRWLESNPSEARQGH